MTTKEPNPERNDDDRDQQRENDRFAKAYWNPLYQALMRQVENPEDARDLAQETFEKMLAGNRIHLIRQPLRYLLKTALRAYHALRVKARRARITYSSEAADAACEMPHALARNELLDELSAQSELHWAFEKLSRVHQKVLVLYFAGQTIPEIARQLGVSEHTARKYLTQAHTEIRMSYAPDADT